MGVRPSERKWAEWLEARRLHGLSDTQVQMARELGMIPDSLRKLAVHAHGKLPLREFLQECYRKRFARESPEIVLSIEECMRRDAANRAKKLARKAARAKRPKST